MFVSARRGSKAGALSLAPFPVAEYDSRNILSKEERVIRSFRCEDTAALFRDWHVPRFAGVDRVARRKLLYLHGAGTLEDLRVPPGNRLEALKGDRAG